MDETDFEDFKDLEEVIASKEFKQLYNKLPESDSEEIEEINDRYSIKHEMALEDVFSFFGQFKTNYYRLVYRLLINLVTYKLI